MAGLEELVVADGDGVALAVHVQPGAGRTALVGRHGDALRLRVAAPPVDDRANEAVVALLAELLDVAKGKVTLVSGGRTRQKRFRVAGVDRLEVVERLERAIDEAIAPPGPRRRRGDR